ncbi:Signal transduction histidine kinase [Nitrosotalea devaniterrae]|uniref:Signal transduction histidine kinase n=1 Tax=Nitrosotalea devaniterrae TaxID=1078905 RepID=A0A128A545_9ARCH|nr:Signal transduction histidine kinase [Candidatus Nitrosotalea devanaterra]
MAISTIAVVVIWLALYIPESEKLQSNFQIYLEQEGEDQIANKVGGDLSQPFDLRESLIQKVTSTDGDYVTISSVVSGLNEDAEKEVFHSERFYQVNAYTQTYKDMPEKQFAFKPGVQKQNYDFVHPLVFADAPLVYQKTDVINGLDVYVFRAETHNVDISDSFPQYANVHVLSNTNSTFWVEPITGDLVKFEKSWEDYQVQDNKTIAINEKGWKKTTTYSSFILSQTAKSTIDEYNYNRKIMPALLASLTIGINLIFILRNSLKQSNEVLIKNEKLSAVGNLSARISHDLRNTLTVIKSEVSLISFQDVKDEKMNERLRHLTHAIDKMDHQIGGVLDFVRERPLKIETFSSHALISNTVENISVPDGIKIVTPEQDVSITGDFAQLEIVLSNIIINSIHAMGESGTITISIENKLDTFVISITDTGPGIPEKYMTKIFEPLFTTKQRGTGLGLASCMTIIKNHGGKIWVKNNPTTFIIQLPKTQNPDSKIT